MKKESCKQKLVTFRSNYDRISHLLEMTRHDTILEWTYSLSGYQRFMSKGDIFLQQSIVSYQLHFIKIAKDKNLLDNVNTSLVPLKCQMFVPFFIRNIRISTTDIGKVDCYQKYSHYHTKYTVYKSIHTYFIYIYVFFFCKAQ